VGAGTLLSPFWGELPEGFFGHRTGCVLLSSLVVPLGGGGVWVVQLDVFSCLGGAVGGWVFFFLFCGVCVCGVCCGFIRLIAFSGDPVFHLSLRWVPVGL